MVTVAQEMLQNSRGLGLTRWYMIRVRYISLFKNGTILSNAGHYRFDINCEEIKAAAVEVTQVKSLLMKFLEENKVRILDVQRHECRKWFPGNVAIIVEMDFGRKIQHDKVIVEVGKITEFGMWMNIEH